MQDKALVDFGLGTYKSQSYSLLQDISLEFLGRSFGPGILNPKSMILVVYNLEMMNVEKDICSQHFSVTREDPFVKMHLNCNVFCLVEAFFIFY